MIDWLERLLDLVPQEEAEEPADWELGGRLAGMDRQRRLDGTDWREQAGWEGETDWPEGDARPGDRLERMTADREWAAVSQAGDWAEREGRAAGNGAPGERVRRPAGRDEGAPPRGRPWTPASEEERMRTAQGGQIYGASALGRPGRDGEEALPGRTRTGADQSVWVGRSGWGELPWLEMAGVSDSRREWNALGLYQAVVRTGRAAQAARSVQTSSTANHQSTGAPSLTVDELDRAVRRDSRRYDGAMELY